MELTQGDYEERKARTLADSGTDDDVRLVKLYEREGFKWRGSSTEKSSSSTESSERLTETVNQSNAPMTAPPSSKPRTGSSTAHRTGGRGRTSASSGGHE